MLISSVRGGNAFAAKQKIRERKTRAAKLSAQKLKITPTKSEKWKHGLSPEEIERRSLAGDWFKTISNMHRIEKIEKRHDRLDRCNKNRYATKRKKLRKDLIISEKVLVSVERIKKKAPINVPGK